jgi:KDO2-lipid IV(A) lauroyltransferase
VEYLVVRGMELFCRALPRRLLLGLARSLGLLWFSLDRRRRQRALANLEGAFGDEMTPERRHEVARNAFANLARAFCDTLILESWNADKVAKYVEVEGWEHLDRAYEAGQGVLCFTGHIGCWEMVAHIQGHRKRWLAVVVRPLDNPLLDAYADRLRRHSGNETIRKRQAVRTILRRLREGKGVGIVIDQHLHSRERIFVDFFGRLAATTPALAMTAMRTGAAMVPVFSIPKPDGGYIVRYLPPVEVTTTGDRKKDVHDITQECTRIIEQMIRAHPDNWIWMHRRWRSKPGKGKAVPADADLAAWG